MIEHACRSGQDCGRPRCCTVFTRTSTVGRAIHVPGEAGGRGACGEAGQDGVGGRMPPKRRACLQETTTKAARSKQVAFDAYIDPLCPVALVGTVGYSRPPDTKTFRMCGLTRALPKPRHTGGVGLGVRV